MRRPRESRRGLAFVRHQLHVAARTLRRDGIAAVAGFLRHHGYDEAGVHAVAQAGLSNDGIERGVARRAGARSLDHDGRFGFRRLCCVRLSRGLIEVHDQRAVGRLAVGNAQLRGLQLSASLPARVARGRLCVSDRCRRAEARGRECELGDSKAESHLWRVAQSGLFKQAELDGSALTGPSDDEHEPLASFERDPFEHEDTRDRLATRNLEVPAASDR